MPLQDTKQQVVLSDTEQAITTALVSRIEIQHLVKE